MKSEIINNYLHKIKSANKELTKKELFKDLLHRLYAGNAEIEEIIDAISAGSEKTILNIPRKDKLHRGSADTLYNKIIIEFENDLRATLKHAKEQLAGYVLGQFNSGEGYNYTLIASDFINWKVFALDISCIERLGNLKEDELILNEISSSSFILTENNAEDFYYWLDRFLFKEEKQKATLQRIEDAFGYNSSVFIECLREMTKHFGEAKKYGEVQVSYDQWKRFLSIAYGSFNDSENNFLIHTYLSIFSKMLAYSVVSNDDYIDDEEMQGIIDGSIFHKYNIQNFVENDFFHWVKNKNNFYHLNKKVFRLIAQEISSFDFNNVEEDILKGVYQELIDLDTRHALGEYYTPDWLCERIVKEYNFNPTNKILDPACGSGSFLRAAIHRLKELNHGITSKEISECVYGIDIHPLSVQIAKTTMLLALFDDFKSLKKSIRLNIILANTLLMPKGGNIFGDEFTVQIDKKKFILNSQILDDNELFDEALNLCDDLAENTANKKKQERNIFSALLKKKYPDGGFNGNVTDGFYKIYEGLKEVKEKGRNSIWKFLLQNFYKPYFLKEHFDYIIGNPPWFTYSSVKNEEYQDILNVLADKYEVKPASVANFPHLEIAAIFMSHCSSYFLKENGKIAFVLPRSFFNTDQHDNTRSGKSRGFRLTEIWDLDKVSPLFRIPSGVLFAERTSITQKTKKTLPVSGLDGKIFSGKIPTHNCHLKVAEEKLTEENTKWFYVQQGKSSAFSTKKSQIQNKRNPYKKEFKQGATIVPRTFYFVNVYLNGIDENGEGLDWEDRVVSLKTATSIFQDAKMPWKEIKFKGFMHSKYIFRTALSKSILPFALYKPDLVVLPIEIKIVPVEVGGLEKKTINVKKIKLLILNECDDSEAMRWFGNAQNIWEIHSTEKSKKMSANDRLDFQRGLTEQNLNAPYLVLYNASAKDANATIVKRKDLDLEFIVESVTYVFYTTNLNEAYYLTSILNSATPNEMMKDFQAKGLFGPRHVHKKILDIYFPKYDEKQATHTQLAALGKAAHQKTEKFLKAHPPQQNLAAHHLGKMRVEIKKHLVEEMKEIDEMVKKIVG